MIRRTMILTTVVLGLALAAQPAVSAEPMDSGGGPLSGTRLVSQSVPNAAFFTTYAVSPDGRLVVFGNAYRDETNHLYVRDLATGESAIVDQSTEGEIGSDDVNYASVGADHSLIAFSSNAPNLVDDDTNGASDVFMRDLAAGTTTVLEVTIGGGAATEGSWSPRFSRDGRYIAFVSASDDLVGEVIDGSNVFMKDTATGAVDLVSRGLDGEPADGDIYSLAMSADGRFLTWASTARNLSPGERDDEMDVFHHDRSTGTTTKVTVPPGGGKAKGRSFNSDVSDDGQTVVFQSEARNLVPLDDNRRSDVFSYDVATGTITLISHRRSTGGTTTGASYNVTISGDGRYVAYDAENPRQHVPGCGECFMPNIVVKDLVDDDATLIARLPSGEAPRTESGFALISDSRTVVYGANSSLHPDDTDDARDVYSTRFPR